MQSELNSSAQGLGTGQNVVLTEHGGGVVNPFSHPHGVV